MLYPDIYSSRNNSHRIFIFVRNTQIYTDVLQEDLDLALSASICNVIRVPARHKFLSESNPN